MADKLKIRPLHDGVIIQRLEAEQKSPGGIVMLGLIKEMGAENYLAQQMA